MVLLADNFMQGEQIKESGVSGHLCLKSPLPGMGRNVNGDQNRFKKDYFTPFPGTTRNKWICSYITL